MGVVAAIDNDWEFASNGVRTVVLVGRTGDGKSSTGNSILGTKMFRSKSSSGGVTKTFQLQSTELKNGQILNVIDTPGLFDYSAKFEVIRREIIKCINMAKDGIHAVLLVLSTRSRFSLEEEYVIKSLREIFGTKISDYMIIVFTGGDGLENDGETLDDYLGCECPEPLQVILEMCGNRCILFNNSTNDEGKKARQLDQLLSLVDVVVDKNGSKPYTNELFVEMKKKQEGEAKLHDSSAETEFKKQFDQKIYEEQLDQRITELVESKLRETTKWLKEQLDEERSARMKSNEEMRLLREKLVQAEKETAELRNRGNCAIL